MEDETTTIEDERSMELEQTRFRDLLNVKKFVTEQAERVAVKLNEMIAQGHDTTAFAIAIVLASLKDGLDIVLDLLGIGVIPILGAIPGWFLTAVLFYFLWGKGYFNRFKVKVMLWGLAFFVDGLPGVNALPMTVFTVLMAWHVVRKRARQAEEELIRLNEMTQEELEVIESEQ